MHDEHPHPLLAQVPLTVSPFLSLPTSVPLPYSYKQLPSTLPPSITRTNDSSAGDPNNPQQQTSQSQSAPYVVSASGTSATPDQILSSCVALQRHLEQLEADARRTLQSWEEKRRAADLAEKRRVAPGWLDNDVHMLRPENVDEGQGQSGNQGQGQSGGSGAGAMEGVQSQQQQAGVVQSKEGEELDRVFGGLKV